VIGIWLRFSGEGGRVEPTPLNNPGESHRTRTREPAQRTGSIPRLRPSARQGHRRGPGSARPSRSDRAALPRARRGPAAAPRAAGRPNPHPFPSFRPPWLALLRFPPLRRPRTPSDALGSLDRTEGFACVNRMTASLAPRGGDNPLPKRCRPCDGSHHPRPFPSTGRAPLSERQHRPIPRSPRPWGIGRQTDHRIVGTSAATVRPPGEITDGRTT
jgi:hypothetical protein